MQAIKQQNSSNGRYLVRREIYAKDKKFTYWRSLLPTELEDHVIHCVHTLLVQLKTEKSININKNPTRSNSMQSDLFYCKIALHVLGVHRTHHQEY